MESDALPGIVSATGQGISADESLYNPLVSVVDDMVTAHPAKRHLPTAHLQYDLVVLPRVFGKIFPWVVDACNGFGDI